ncbi:MAG: hypothetical protein HOE90_23070 [Bacteriovoracaceae bacterium]|jgi:hypothetical protein|nr:hypothetical protein [Bacteriovoracaceae bacterium]
MKLFAIFFGAYLIFNISLSFSADKNPAPLDRRDRLLKIIDEEINLIKMVKRKKANLEHRLFELYNEKTKLLKEKENRSFLKATKRGAKKSEYFAKSISHNGFVKSFAKKIIKRHPRYHRLNEIYYSLALNSRDYDKDKATKHYLYKALKITKKNSKLGHQIYVALAEYFYNKKKYVKAIKLYRVVIGNKSDNWHAKHLYNLSWCYLKIMKYRSAIKAIRVAYIKSKNGQYISVKEQVLQSIGPFYVYAGEIEKGVSFYTKNEKAPIPYLLKMIDVTTKKGKFEDVQYILAKSHAMAKASPKKTDSIQIYMKELDIYRNYQKSNLHYRSTKHLWAHHKQGHLGKNQVAEIVEKTKAYVGFLQIKLAQDVKKNSFDFKASSLTMVIGYFDFLVTFDPKNQDEYNFFQGESYFSVGKFQLAATKYVGGLKFSDKNPKAIKIKEKLINSLFAVLDEGNFNKVQKQNWQVYAYEYNLKYWPKTPRSKRIYPLLFELYFAKKGLDKSLAVISKFAKFFPGEIVAQRELTTRLIDYHIVKKDTERLAHWIKKMKAGFLSFGASKIQKTELVLGQILFQNFEGMQSTGKLIPAIKGYISLYKNPIYPDSIKQKTSFNTALLLLKISHTSKSAKWMVKTLGHRTEDNLVKNAPRFIEISKLYASLLDYKSAKYLASKFLLKTCSKGYSQKQDLFYVSSYQSINKSDLDSFKKDMSFFRKCGLTSKTEQAIGDLFISKIISHRDHDALEESFTQIKLSSVGKESFAGELLNWYWDIYFTSGKNQVKNNLRKLLNKHDQKYQYLSKFNKIWKKYQKTHLPPAIELQNFDERLFNKTLTSALSSLQKSSAEITSLSKYSDKNVILGMDHLTSNIYHNYSTYLKNIKFIFSDKGFEKSFYGQVAGVAAKLNKKAREFKRHGSTLIVKHQSLSSFNRFFIETPLSGIPTFQIPNQNLETISYSKRGAK